MKLKKMVAAAMTGAMLMSTAAPIVADNMAATAYAAKGGAKIGGGSSKKAVSPSPSAKSAVSTKSSNSKAAVPSANSGAKAAVGASGAKAAAGAEGSGSKAVSGNGGSYQPSKDAKSLDKNAPSTGAAANAKGNTSTNNNAAAATNSQSGSRWGSALRNVGLLAGGMMLGSMLSSALGMHSGMGGIAGMMGDIMGLVFNLIMLLVVIMAIKWLWNKFRSNKNSDDKNVYQTANRPEPINVTPPTAAPKAPIMDIKGPASGTDYDAKTMADRYRNK